LPAGVILTIHSYARVRSIFVVVNKNSLFVLDISYPIIARIGYNLNTHGGGTKAVLRNNT
jgi:hypothetical protein